MKPNIALKMEYSPLENYTRAQVEAVRDSWIAEYKKIAEENPAKAELCRTLTERICLAADLFSGVEQYDSLNGDFPLGNEDDMEFASYFFSVRELALIQTGLSHTIKCGYFA